jgi:predicted TIM-barrel fold metal-dependent hydrolase
MNEWRSMTRRQAIESGVMAAGLSVLTSAAQAEESEGWIDAHSHIWPAETDKFPLVAGLTKRELEPASFTDEELMAIADPEGVTRVVLIQHSVFHLFDNAYLIDAVRRHPKRFRVVGMVDDHQADPATEMKRLRPVGVTGFRITPFIRKIQPENWLKTEGMRQMWKTAAETKQAMCCLINPEHLSGVDAMCDENPETPVVIDHFARIGVDGQMRSNDIQKLVRLARHKQTSVKLSAFYALGQKKPPHLELVPMIKQLYDAFGPPRLMWASDCPYQIQGVNNYKASISLIRDQLDFVSAEDKAWLLRKTAERVFFNL